MVGRVSSVVALAAAGVLWADVPQAAPIPRLPTARAQLEHARGIKRAMKGRETVARERLRARAVAAYRAVRELHGSDPPLCAEAAFRAGELLRAGGRSAEALEEFRHAKESGRGTVFRARGLLEIGHIHRRERRRAPALEAYLAVVADARARRCYRDDASIWAGSVWASIGRVEDARRIWTRVAGEAEDPVDRIRAFDELALSWLDGGDPQAAAGVLARCKLSLAEVSLEETELGERVRNALLRMRIVRALQRAVAGREREKGVGGTRSRSRIRSFGSQKKGDGCSVILDNGRRIPHRIHSIRQIRWIREPSHR